MPNIKPISDLRNYATVLETVQVGKPLYLTKNGRGCYTVMNIDEQEEQREKAEKYDRMQAQLRLMCELAEGRRSGEEEGWISSEDYIEFELCNPSAAQNTVDGIMDKVDGIASFPESGAKLVFENGLDSGYRYVVFKNYLTFYRLRPNNVVYVDRVIYGDRDYMRILFPGL